MNSRALFLIGLLVSLAFSIQALSAFNHPVEKRTYCPGLSIVTPYYPNLCNDSGKTLVEYSKPYWEGLE